MYDISILSSIPSSVSDRLPLEPLPTRLHSLFSVGIHDTPILSQGSRDETSPKQSQGQEGDMGYGWVACTTDDILSVKIHLYDTLATIPPSYSQQATEKVWPTLMSPPGNQIKATQRDARRYVTFRRGLRRYQRPGSSGAKSPFSAFRRSSTAIDEPPIENPNETFDDATSTADETLLEPQSWSALAYDSFMWWASAGEQRSDLDEEAEHDANLLRIDYNRQPYGDSPDEGSQHLRPRSSGKSPGPMAGGLGEVGFEMTVIAYFHRLTTLILETLANIVDAMDTEISPPPSPSSSLPPNGDSDSAPLLRSLPSNHDPEESDPVTVEAEDMSRMGLDVWSEADRRFVEECVSLYWGRRTVVKAGRVECCGVRLR